MTHIGARIARLERNRPEPLAGAELDLDLPPDICERIITAKTAGTFPQSLSLDDLRAVSRAMGFAQGLK